MIVYFTPRGRNKLHPHKKLEFVLHNLERLQSSVVVHHTQLVGSGWVL